MLCNVRTSYTIFLFFYTMSYHCIQCHTIWYNVIPLYTMSYQCIQCHTILHNIIPCYMISYYIISYPVSYNSIPCYTLSHNKLQDVKPICKISYQVNNVIPSNTSIYCVIIPCCKMSWHVPQWHVMFHNIMLFFPI